MSHAVVAIDETQRIVLFNRGAEALFGYAAAEILGQPLDTLLPESARAAHRRHVQGFAAEAGGYRPMAGRPDIQGRRRDGTLFPAQAALSKATVGGRTYMAAVVYDLSHSEALRAVIDAADPRHGALFTQTPVGLVFIDTEGTWLEVNPTAAVLLGYSREELVGRRFDTITHPDDVETDRRLLRRTITGEVPCYARQKRYSRKDGTTLWADITVAPLRAPGEDVHHLIVLIEDSAARFWKELGAILDQSLNEIYVFDAETLRFLSANHSACHNLGYTRRELEALTPLDLKPAFTPQGFAALLQPLRDGTRRRIDFTTRHRRKDGTQYDVRVQLQQTSYSGRPAFLAVIEDITEYKKAQEARRLLERRFQDLVDSIDGIVWEADAESLRFTFVSRQAERLLGYPLDRWLAEPTFWKDHIHPEDADWATEYCLRSSRERRPHQFEYRMIAADGRVVWLHDVVTVAAEDGRILLRGIMIDVTDRKRRDEDLRAKTEQLQLIADVLGSFLATEDQRQATRQLLAAALQQSGSEYGFIGIMHGETLRVTDCLGIAWSSDTNRAFCEKALTAYREKGYLEFTDFDNLFGAVIVSGKPVLSNDPARDRRAGGLPPGHPPLRSFLGVPMTSGNAVVGMIGVANRDGGYGPTEQEKLETLARMATVLYDSHRRAQRQAEIEAQLRQAQKMETVGQLTGGIAHDFNNLLQVILGNLDIVAARLAEGSDAHRAAGLIKRAGERAAQLTQQLLSFARRQPLAPAPVGLATLIEEALPFLQRTLGEDIEIRADVPPQSVWVFADRTQLDSALLNLAINARDAMPRGGVLTLAADTIEIDATAAAARGIAPGSYGRLRVADTGCGMTAEVQAKAFDPFFTTKEVGKGTGLGLSMVYGFAKQSGGHAEIDSAPGRGTTVTILLPRSEPDASAETVPAKAGGTPTAKPATILVVEDDAMVRALVLDQIRSLGYAAVEAEDGPSALARLAEMPHIDLLFTDLVMPGGLNGKELAEKARQARPGLKVLFTSGYPAQADGQLDRQVRLLAKPYRNAELARALQQCLAAHSASRQADRRPAFGTA